MDDIARRKHIYNQYRTTLLNQKYHSHKLKVVKLQILYIDIAIIVGAAGSGISGWQLWESPCGLEIWGGITGFSALLATIKPILNLPSRVELYSKLYSGHSKIYNEIKALVMSIDRAPLTEKESETFDDIFLRFGKLTELEEPISGRKLIKKLQKEVNIEIPPQSLWMPED